MGTREGRGALAGAVLLCAAVGCAATQHHGAAREVNGPRVLHLNLLTVTVPGAPDPRPGEADAAVAAAQVILAQAGLRLAVDNHISLRGTPFGIIDSFGGPDDPPDAPGGPVAALLAAGARATVPGGPLNVYVVARLPPGFAGYTPRPPAPGVLVRRDTPAAEGRALAHELAHALGLPHVRTIDPDGTVHDDGIADTEPAGDNLMSHGAHLTPGQSAVLTRSPRLRRE